MMKKVILLKEVYMPKAEVIKENNELFLHGVFMEGDIKNNNNRIYPNEILEREANKFQELILQSRAVGELDHPDSLTINLERVSHVIKELGTGNKHGQWLGKLKILGSPLGQVARSLIESEIPLAISSRGVGSLTEADDGNMVGEDYNLITHDLVHSPGAPNALLGISETKEYLFDGKQYHPIFHSLPEFDQVEDHNLDYWAKQTEKFIKSLK